MKSYRAIYKCRLCGERFPDTILEYKEVLRVISAFEKGDGYYESFSGRNGVSATKAHFCKNGDIGLADFLGFLE